MQLRQDITEALPVGRTARVAVVRAGGLGDSLLLLPALRLIAGAAAVELTWVGSAWAEALEPLVALPVTVLRFDSPALTPLFGPAPQEDPTGAFASADLAVVYTSESDDTLPRNVRRLCRGRVVEWPARPAGEAHAAMHFARAVAADPARLDELPLPQLCVPGRLRRWARAWLGERLGSGDGFVAVHPGSGGGRKCWPAERFAALIEGLIEALGRPILLLEGPADAEACRQVADLLPPGAPVATARGLSVPDVAALIAEAGLYVGNDSGLTHLAAGLGAPTMAVFGPTDPAVWAPLGSRARAVSGTGCAGSWPSPEAVRDAALDLRNRGLDIAARAR